MLNTAHQIVPLQQTVTLTPMTPRGEPITVDGARKRSASEASEFESVNLKITNRSALWILPTLNLGGHAPMPGDLITDEDDVDWILEGVTDALSEAEYKAVAQRKRGP